VKPDFFVKGAECRKKGIKALVRGVERDRGETVLIFVGNGTADRDSVGMAMVEAALDHGGNVVVVTRSESERCGAEQRWYGQLIGVTSIEGIEQKVGEGFDWPHAMPYLPNPKTDGASCRQLFQLFEKRTIRPLAEAIGQLLGVDGPALAQLDVVMNRAEHDALGMSLPLLKPRTGRAVFAEEMVGRRYSFFAPQVWQERRRIMMPTASIVGMGPIRLEAMRELETLGSLEERIG
jgi:NAD(P)-dependent dehydrogenase (short-subunit alcohol dehydrogenase family)